MARASSATHPPPNYRMASSGEVPERKIARQLTPLTAGFHHVQQGIHYPALLMLPRPASRVTPTSRFVQQRTEPGPLLVRQTLGYMPLRYRPKTSPHIPSRVPLLVSGQVLSLRPLLRGCKYSRQRRRGRDILRPSPSVNG